MRFHDCEAGSGDSRIQGNFLYKIYQETRFDYSFLKEALCTVEETVSLGKRDCKCGGFSNDDPYCESRHWFKHFDERETST